MVTRGKKILPIAQRLDSSGDPGFPTFLRREAKFTVNRLRACNYLRYSRDTISSAAYELIARDFALSPLMGKRVSCCTFS